MKYEVQIMNENEAFAHVCVFVGRQILITHNGLQYMCQLVLNWAGLIGDHLRFFWSFVIYHNILSEICELNILT